MWRSLSLLPSPPAPQQLSDTAFGFDFFHCWARFVSSFHQAQVSCMMPWSVNCFCAGEANGVPRTAAQFRQGHEAIWKHLDLGR